jgi:hypothetical protein
MFCLVSFAFVAPASGQQASLIGTVLDDSTERPIANAEVAIDALNRVVRSDSAGNFSIAAIPAGTYRVIVRMLGRQPAQETITFGATDRVERDYLLARATTTLTPVEVKTSGSVDAVRLAEFEERRKLGFGRFLTQDVMEKATGRSLSDVLAGRIPGLRSTSLGGTQRAMVSTRGALNMQRPTRPCLVQVIVDGMIRYNGNQEPFNINGIEPMNVAGIEYYTTSQTPVQFNGTGTPCGTLVVWTRMR